ncbi:hypothetical protein HDV57DRAFT_281730 [Trichoderma longibrachiatum]|uniref:Transcription factor domain-containing protein n=1 Tax=Trichoderma longibrachiatum ATCC 18648 TaxID=983965 RepID=A0A2T4CDQ4_TRILO|nr:hypothetical protein M440DRAFT_1420005 [Trichoderma longibrachiatum ATCC 18648]
MLHRPLPTSTSTSRPPALQPARPPSGSLAPNHNHSHSSSSSSTTPNRPPVMKLQFINTAHPRDSTSAKRISQIRSHVARDSHARRRQRKAANGSNACACACPTASSAASHAPAAPPAEPPARPESPDSTSAGTSSVGARSRLPTSSSPPASVTCAAGGTTAAEDEDSQGFRRIAPKTKAVARSADLPHPRKLIGDTKTDGWSFAWELSTDECKTFDFFLDWVLTYGYEICFPRDEVPRVMSRMRTTYVPFAIKHPCLLACIFYISYHRRYLNTDDPGEAARCHLLMQQYRLACIEMMKSALAVEKKPSAQTITLAMQLCSEAFFEGNPDISFTHAYAARTMVSARGGLESFDQAGVDALISFLLATSVYSGNYWFVPGCAKFMD